MDIKKINEQLQRLLRSIISSYKSDKSRDPSLISKSVNNSKTVENTENCIDQNVANLELCVRYLLFDLDATRRERNFLQKRLDDAD